MKKYKLIKTYPNSQPLGTIISEDSLGQYVTEKAYIFQKEDVENFPEFWEEIPEFKILKFSDKIVTNRNKSERHINIYNVLPDNTLLWDIPEYKGITSNPGAKSVEDALLNDSPYSIYSIERTSDGEIFTIGDKISIGIHTYRNYTTIDKIYMNEHKQLSFSILDNKPKQATTVLTDDVLKYDPTNALSYDQLINGNIYKTTFKGKDTYIFRCGYNLWRRGDDDIKTHNGDFTPKNGFNEFYLATEEEAKKLERRVCCISEDGAKLYQGDEYWFIWLEKIDVNRNTYTPFHVENISYSFNKHEKCLVFSTLEAAETYIKEHVLFTTEDGVEIHSNEEVYQVDEKLNFYYFKNWYGNLGENGKPAKGRVSFYTKKAADEYIRLNKPVFSLEDINSASSFLCNAELFKLKSKLEKIKNEKV